MTKQTAPTKIDLEAMIREAGGTVLCGGSFEDDYVIVAQSVETYGPGSYCHPRYGIVYHKDTRWMQADLNGRNADRKFA